MEGNSEKKTRCSEKREGRVNSWLTRQEGFRGTFSGLDRFSHPIHRHIMEPSDLVSQC
jgi:hypothetical protein